MTTCAVTVSIPTYKRSAQLLDTLARIKSCDPTPQEVIVHVDGYDTETGPLVRDRHPDVTLIFSPEQAGPGGGRNKILAQASCPIVASFDDDSYPLDPDYFARLVETFETYPEAGVVEAAITYKGDAIREREGRARWVADFTGCGCAYRLEAFRQTRGYLPRAVGYGIEETDMAIQMLDAGWRVLFAPWLRVYHDTELHHHVSPRVTAGSLTNRALLAFVRYPVRYWGWGVGQYANAFVYSLRMNRRKGLGRGLRETLPTLWDYRSERHPVGPEAIATYRRLRHGSEAASPPRLPEG